LSLIEEGFMWSISDKADLAKLSTKSLYLLPEFIRAVIIAINSALVEEGKNVNEQEKDILTFSSFN
ncbi:12850_t:CDS:2, partial [Entrophospora sp. SA101]